jgi:hypothetical protein
MDTMASLSSSAVARKWSGAVTVHGFVEFAELYVRLRASSCGLHDVLSGAADGLDLAARINQLQRAMRRLVQRGQHGGVIRDDLDWRDVPFVLATAIPTDHTIGLEAKPDQWRQNLRIILDGLRPAVDKSGDLSQG